MGLKFVRDFARIEGMLFIHDWLFQVQPCWIGKVIVVLGDDGELMITNFLLN